MRALALLMFLSTPAFGWEASSDGRICRLDHSTPEVEVALTYDPAVPIYAITLTRPGQVWPNGDVFVIAYAGAAPLTISTNRHMTDGSSPTVSDSGFGNVLNGLAFNTTATALLGSVAIPIDLSGARPEVEAFVDCTRTPSAGV
ncbi:MAG: excinuclease ABC subunit B [Paracoccaceae bacterium]